MEVDEGSFFHEKLEIQEFFYRYAKAVDERDWELVLNLRIYRLLYQFC